MNRGTLVALTGAALMLLGPGAAHAAAPANDAFAAAAPLTAGDQVSSSNVDATVEAGEPNPTGFAASETCLNIAAGANCGTSVWYTFQPASSGQYTIGICDGGTDVYGIVGVYTGTPGSLTQIGASGQGQQCASLGNNLAGTQVTFVATAGTVYHVDVTGHGGAQGSFYLTAYAGPAKAPPSPDTAVDQRASFANAVNALSVAPGVSSGPRRSGSFALLSDAPGATFECALDGAPFAACDSSVSYDGLSPGSSHEFRARAVAGGVTDATPAIARFTIDSAPPDTVMLSGPTGPLASQMATWTAGGSERYNRGVFACGLDSIPTFACNSAQTFTQLCAGPHSFHAAALDYAANIDPTPASAAIEVTTGTACAAPTVSPSSSVVPTTTGALLHVPYDDKGAGGRLHIEYGPTTAYGMETEDTNTNPGPATETKRSLVYVTPNTLTHYRVTITTPFGSAATGDQTLTTKPPEGALPTIANGTPRVNGEHAASIPATIDPGGVASNYRLLIAAGAPATGASAAIENAATVSGPGPQPALANIVDLEPATTYHYRFAVEQQSGGGDVLGPEGTFTTPPFPVATTAVNTVRKSRFRLRKRQIRIGRIEHRSKVLIVRVKGLPAKIKVQLKLTAGKSKQSARKRAKANGRLRFKLTLSKRIRKALRDRKLKKVTLKVTAMPPGEPKSSVTLTKALKG